MTAGRLPVVSGHQLVRWLGTLSYRIDRQRGSHIRLELRTATGTHALTVPNHREIAKGTLNDILVSVARTLGRGKQELIRELSDF